MSVFTRWDQVLPTGDTNEVLKALALWHTGQISDQRIRETVTAAVSSNDFRTLCDYVVDYSAISVADATYLRQTLAFYQKREDLDIGVDKEAAARSTFIAAERLCGETNHIFRLWSSGKFQFLPELSVYFLQLSGKSLHYWGMCRPSLN